MNKEEEISKNDKTQSTFIIQDEEVINPVKTEIQESKAEVEKVKENKPVVSKLDLLQKVIDRQNELEERLQELKHKERSRSKTENDLISRLDEMEQLDELEDEMDRYIQVAQFNFVLSIQKCKEYFFMIHQYHSILLQVR